MRRAIAPLQGLRDQRARQLEEATADQTAASNARRTATQRVNELETELTELDAAIAALEAVAPDDSPT